MARIAIASLLVLAAGSASAAPRSVEVRWTYPGEGAPYTGVALYHAASLADLNSGINLTRIDLGLPAADPTTGEASLFVDGFDDTRDYYLVLRVYDASGSESPNSRVGVVAAAAPTNAGPPLAESFESYRGGQDPDGWSDSASGSTAPGDATLFETVDLSDGTIAFGTSSTATDIHSHLVTSESTAWTSYEYSGRIVSQTLDGEAGVTVLSQYPTSLTYYRLARVGAGAYAVTVRGGGSLTCAATSSTGIAAQPGVWLRFRVRVTRFDSRNRIRAMVYPEASSAPSAWAVDCWDGKATTAAAGTVGVYASGAPGTWWDDLQVVTVASDGAPPSYQPASETPSTPTNPDAYTSRASLVHWWVPGRDAGSIGRDFAWRAPAIDAGTSAKGISAKDVVGAGEPSAFVDLDGASESLGNKTLQRYNIGDSWSLAAWVRPDAKARKKPRYIVDLNGQLEKRSQSRISLVVDSNSRFAIEITDASGRSRSLSAILPIEASALGNRWYHIVAVKAGTASLLLYVDGRRVAFTDVGVPAQGDVARTLRVGTRVKSGRRYGFAGGVHSVGLWSTALAPAEVRAVYANGNRAYDPR